MYRRELYDRDGHVIETEERAYTAEEKMRNWTLEMARTDLEINARVLEEIYEALPKTVKDKLSRQVHDKFARRKAIRERQPTLVLNYAIKT